MKPATEATPIQPTTDATLAPRQRTYERPTLEVLGDVRDLTLGGTPGTGDSGFPNQDPPQPPISP